MLKSRFRAASALAAVLISGAAIAETVAPGDVVVENLEVSTSLTGAAGDPAVGREVFADRKLGNCLACHANADLSAQLFHGNVGPAMDGAGGRWTEGQLRTIVVNSKNFFGEQTIMPGFYSLDVGKDVRTDLVGKTILTAEEVEDVVAYLQTLK